MKRVIKTSLAIAASIAAISSTMAPAYVSAWGDNGGGRPSYTIEEINAGKLGNKVVFNSISDSVIGDEKNFVGTRECVNGECGGANKTTIWQGNEINVKDGQTYIIRLYAHNNNPSKNVVAKDTRVHFVLPTTSAKEIEVNGVITSSNATPSKYWDHVTFKSDTPFHLEYIKGSALLENNKIASGGLQLSDNIVTSKEGILIGYDALNGRIPGCYQYDEFVTIQVKTVFDGSNQDEDKGFTVETKVRHAGEKEWQESIEANIGDKVEFQIRYTNTSKQSQKGVSMRDVLPQSLRYVPGSTKIKNSNFPNGGNVESDVLVGENGLAIGDAGPDSGTVVMFTAEVIEEGLGCGTNTLVNWGNASVNGVVVKDDARVITNKVCTNPEPVNPEPTPTPDQPSNLPTTGPGMMVGGVVAAGSIATAAGYYIASRRQLKR